MTNTDSKKVGLTDTTLGDALFSRLATPPSMDELLPLAALLDKVGFRSAEVSGPMTFLASMRDLRDDPWERLRRIKKVMTGTPLQITLKGRCLLGNRLFPDDVIEALVGSAAGAGIEIFRVFDSKNELKNIDPVVRAVKASGNHAQGGVAYAESSTHTLEHFVETARALESMGCDSVCIRDPKGLLAPFEASRLVRMIGEVMKLPIHLSAATMNGMATATYLKGIEGGVKCLDTALSPLGGKSSPPAAEGVIAMLRSTPHDTGLEIESLCGATNSARGIFEGRAWREEAEKGTKPSPDAEPDDGPGMEALASEMANGTVEDRLAFAFYPEAAKAFIAFRERGDTPEEELASVLGAVLARSIQSVPTPATGLKSSGGSPWGIAGRLESMRGTGHRKDKPRKW